jgi:hypothetical protein
MMRRLALIALFAGNALAAIHPGAERELAPRQLDLASSIQRDGHIASDGHSFLAVWNDQRDYQTNVLAARLDANGAVIDRVPLVVAASGAREEIPNLVWGGDRYLATWRNGIDSIHGRFIFPDGTMSGEIEIVRRDGTFLNVSKVGWNGRAFLVVWMDRFEGTDSVMDGVIVHPDGRAGTVTEIVRGANSWSFDLVATETSFILAYARSFQAASTIVRLPIDDQGRPGTSTTIATTSILTAFAAAARGSDLLVAWAELLPTRSEVHTARIETGGAREDWTIESARIARLHAVGDSAGYQLLEFDSERTLAQRVGGGAASVVETPGRVWVDSAASNDSRAVALAGEFGDLFISVIGQNTMAPLALSPRHQTVPDVAAAGDVKLVVWSEHRTNENRVVVAGMRIGANGPLESEPFVIGNAVNVTGRPRVASNGNDWLVIWDHTTTLYGRRVRHDGTLLDAAPLVLGDWPVARSTAVEWDGSSWIVAYAGGSIVKAGLVQIFVTRVPSSGDPAPTFAINTKGDHRAPALAAGPEGTLIVWTDNYGRTSEAVLLSRGDTVTPLTLPTDYGAPRSVAWNRDTFLVATSKGPFANEIRWLRVDAFGNASETLPVIHAPGVPYVEAFGEHFLLLWAEDRFGEHLFAAVLNRRGELVDGPSIVAETTDGFSADGALIVASHKIDYPADTWRVFLQTLEWTAQVIPRRRSAR